MRGMKVTLKPALLHVCTLVRLEVAALLYGSSHITYKLMAFDFRPFEQWLDILPKEHVNYLSRNRNLTMDLRGHLWQPASEDISQLCQDFGNR